MMTARFVLAVVVLLFGACIVETNWSSVIVSARNRRRGIDRHHSTIPLVSILLAALAYLIYPGFERVWIIAVPLLDIANWQLLWLPVVFFRKSNNRGPDPSAPSDRRKL